MYLPFIRGKQYELIALRELASGISKSSAVSPIIEPVKRSTTTLVKTLKALASAHVNFTLVINPGEGELVNKPNDILEVLESLNGYSNFQIGIIITTEERVVAMHRLLSNKGLTTRKYAFIHNAALSDVEPLLAFSKDFVVIYNVINYSRIRGRRYHRNFPADTLITLEDQFNMQARNVDYLLQEVEQFSEEHKYFESDGYIGFADFATIGEPFSEGGFLPYAVAIHLTFEEEGIIKIRHFVSDSNDDTADVPGKFSEALAKLINWLDNNSHLETSAVREFRRLHNEDHYPGLGSIKKLSLIHHVELVAHLMSS